jgi:L-gulonate 3-dehydrogenase
MAATAETNAAKVKVGIIGSGLIGRSWSMLFASAGYKVVLHDSDPTQLSTALATIGSQLEDLSARELLRGTRGVTQQLALISTTESLSECVVGAKYVMECIPEVLALKQQMFLQIDALVTDTEAVLLSSTSCLPASSFSTDLEHRAQVIVAHPVNPPFFCPLTEVVPAPYTAPSVTTQTLALLTELGQTPVLIKKELPGFALNRVQYAILAECWRLIEDDAISVEDLDKVMTDGLGVRYAFLGPFLTGHLNAEGMQSYVDRYGETISRVLATFGPPPSFSGPVAARIAAEVTALVPLDQLDERRRWRDERLAELARLKQRLGQ